jgi:hypothetical protein
MTAMAVLLGTARPADAAATGAAIAPVLGLGLTDAAHRARTCGGIVAERAAPEVAAALVEALGRRGVFARAIEAAALPAIERPRRATRARAGERALELKLGAAGAEAIVPWEEIRLVLPFAVSETARAFVPARVHAPDFGEPLEVSDACARLIAALRQARARIGLDVITEGRAFRLWREELDYPEESGIAAGLAPHSLERFLALARIVVARALRAPKPPESEALLGAGLLEPALFSDVIEVVRYERWLLANASVPPPAKQEGGEGMEVPEERTIPPADPP